MNIPIITVTNQSERAALLLNSAIKNGWEIHLLKIDWKGFGTKLIETYNFLKEYPEIEQFVFCDAHDVVVLGTPGEFEEKLINKDLPLFSSEKGCWPDSNLSEQYPKTDSNFKYLNSGLYYFPVKLFNELMERCEPKYDYDDQLFFSHIFLSRMLGDKLHEEHLFGITLDYMQRIFNSHSFIADNEYTYDNGRVQILGNEPIFIHSNGKTQDPKLDEMLKEIGLI